MIERSATVRKIANYANAGNAHLITWGQTSLLVTNAGGRLLELNHQGEKLLWANPQVLPGMPKILKLAKEQGWKAVEWGHVNTPGGEKTLVGPQERYEGKVPDPFLNLGRYRAKKVPNGVQLTSPICPLTGLQITREIVLESEATFEIAANVTNRSHEKAGVEPKALEAAPWSIFQMPAPGASIILNGLVSRPHYYAFPAPQTDAITDLGLHSFLLSINPRGMADGEMYKVGYTFMPDFRPGPASALVSFKGRSIGLRVDMPVFPAGLDYRYPDNAPGQVYWNQPYLELENAGPIEILQPGATSLTLRVRGTIGPADQIRMI